jgi:hypothetical protein
MNLSAELRQTLIAVADVLSQASKPWWIISGAACALHGVTTGPTRDVDVLVDHADIEPLLAALNLQRSVTVPHELFRSGSLVNWSLNPLVVEFFADFEVRGEAGWEPVTVASRQCFRLESAQVYAPDRAELAAMLRKFGRPKDLARAALLNSSDPFPSRSGNA